MDYQASLDFLSQMRLGLSGPFADLEILSLRTGIFGHHSEDLDFPFSLAHLTLDDSEARADVSLFDTFQTLCPLSFIRPLVSSSMTSLVSLGISNLLTSQIGPSSITPNAPPTPQQLLAQYTVVFYGALLHFAPTLRVLSLPEIVKRPSAIAVSSVTTFHPVLEHLVMACQQLRSFSCPNPSAEMLLTLSFTLRILKIRGRLKNATAPRCVADAMRRLPKLRRLHLSKKDNSGRSLSPRPIVELVEFAVASKCGVRYDQ